jgi:hypothetical protein
MDGIFVTVGLGILLVALLGLLWSRRPRGPDAEASLQEQVRSMAAADAQLVEALRRRGVDPTVARHIDLEFRAPSEAAARTLAQLLQRALPGRAEITPPDGAGVRAWGLTWVVDAPVAAIVEPLALEQRIRLAAAAGARYDGWGTPLDAR